MTSDRPIYERCWCWQHGRCLTDCPTADLPPPRPITDANWHRAWIELQEAALLARQEADCAE